MSHSSRDHKQRRGSRGWILRQVLFWLWLTALMAAMLVYAGPAEYDLSADDVAPQDIRAPRDITFISDILTERAQAEAARNVASLYTAPDPTIARQQYNRARDVLAYLRAVRADPYGPDAQRRSYVWAVPELADLPEETVQAILTLPESSFNRVSVEFLDLLDQVMRQEEIHETDLTRIRHRIPTMIPLDMAQDEAQVVEDLVERFIHPNVFFDEAATQAAREAAREAVGQAPRIFRSGQIIVREGTVISELDMEVLDELGLTSPTHQEQSIGAAGLFAGLSTLGFGLYLFRLSPDTLDGARQELLLTLLLSVFLGLAWVLVRSGELVPYLFPSAAAGMLVSTTLGAVPAIGATVLLSAVSGWIGARSMAFAAMVLLGGLYAILTLPRYEQTGPLFRSGLIDGVVQALVILVFSIDELTAMPFTLLLKLGMAVVGGLVAGGLTVGGLFVLTPLFDLTTTFRLTELSRPNHPLLQRLLREAPATFNHVMMVTSLAEQAAERIGANALLTRVGAYYHDIGKLSRPYFFVENQQGLSNPHDRLDPYTSVDVLAGHVRDGIKLAKQYGLPARIRAFIPEHHGTTQVSFLYQKAVEAAGGEADLVDESQFRYPGPKPQSRETLLVMLADSCEAATRASRPSTPEALAEIVDQIFKQRIEDGQLDECPITMAELDTVKRAYVDLLRGAFHPRVQYPPAAAKEKTPGPIEAAAEGHDGEPVEGRPAADAAGPTANAAPGGAAKDDVARTPAEPETVLEAAEAVDALADVVSGRRNQG